MRRRLFRDSGRPPRFSPTGYPRRRGGHARAAGFAILALVWLPLFVAPDTSSPLLGSGPALAEDDAGGGVGQEAKPLHGVVEVIESPNATPKSEPQPQPPKPPAPAAAPVPAVAPAPLPAVPDIQANRAAAIDQTAR